MLLDTVHVPLSHKKSRNVDLSQRWIDRDVGLRCSARENYFGSETWWRGQEFMAVGNQSVGRGAGKRGETGGLRRDERFVFRSKVGPSRRTIPLRKTNAA